MAGEPIIQQWATLANYPAGANPWNGQPLKVAPAQQYFTPGVALPAENMNYELNLLSGGLSPVAQGVSIAAAANWGPVFSNVDGANSPFGTVLTMATWDQYHEQWIVYGQGSSAIGCKPYCTYDNGKSWQRLHFAGGDGGLLSNPSYYCIGVDVSPSTGQFVCVRTNIGLDLVANVGNQATTSPTTTSLTGFGSGSATDGALAWLASGSGGFIFVGFSGLTNIGLGLTFDGTTWFNVSGSLPAAWQTVVGEVLGYRVAQSPSHMVFALCGTRPGTDTSRLMIATSGGFTDVTPGLLGVNQQIRGIAYDAVDNLWGMLTQDNASPPNTKLYTSPDPLTGGSTWTLVKTWAATWAGGVACIGSVWCVLLDSVGIAAGANTIEYSGQVASVGLGCVFSRASYADTQTLHTVGDPSTLMLSNGSQVLRVAIGQSPAPLALSGKAWQPSGSNGL